MTLQVRQCATVLMSTVLNGKQNNDSSSGQAIQRFKTSA